MKGAESAGFEYVNSVSQSPQTIWSMHKKKNPLTVLAGNLILNFKKVRNPRTIAITSVGADVIEIMKNTAELVIVRNGGSASTDEIVSEIVVKLLENGLLSDVKTKVGDLAPLLQEYFVFNEIDESWHLPKDASVGRFIPLSERIKFYITDYFRSSERKSEPVNLDDVSSAIFPHLVNGETPDSSTILGVLEQIAYSPDGSHWKLKETRSPESSSQTELFEMSEEQELLPVVPEPSKEENASHNSIIYRLAKLGKAAGYEVYIGKNEQSFSFNGEALSNLSLSDPPIDDLEDYDMRAVEQIDVIWFDKVRRPVFGFEVEHSTPITSGIQRFVSLLKAEASVGGNLVILCPFRRRKKLISELTNSPLVGHPLYMENKIRYGYYKDFLKMYLSLSKSEFKRSDIEKQLNAALHKVRLSET